MKYVVLALFIVFLIWMAIGTYLLQTEHVKAPIVMGLGVMFMAFILMPVFIYHRYKDGKYKKYVIDDAKLEEW
ncbi:hypothetical protein [Tenacibaculum geojense]|uniref:Uncharacterized protein n=1 Tax=Tenacibaculum geojense TaxID=915352 RepID=A0ABW3JQQ8_9FLAO